MILVIKNPTYRTGQKQRFNDLYLPPTEMFKLFKKRSVIQLFFIFTRVGLSRSNVLKLKSKILCHPPPQVETDSPNSDEKLINVTKACR